MESIVFPNVGILVPLAAKRLKSEDPGERTKETGRMLI
jgi:hypothetical protein